MAWTSPKTWVAGEVVTAAMLNTQLRDDLGYLKDSPTFDGDITVTDDVTVGGDVAVTGTLTVGGSAVVTVSPRSLCQGRLTLTSNTPVTTSDVTAATTLYWSPYQGNQIGLYSVVESAWVLFSQAQLSIAVPATTATMYDVFVDYNAGTPALSLTAWTNVTTRATSLTTQDGVLVHSSTLGKRYVGSFCTTGVSGQTEDSIANRLVWNYYNRVLAPVRRIDTTNTWNYTTATFRQAGASASNQVTTVTGWAEDSVSMRVVGMAKNDSVTCRPQVAVGFDSTTTPATGSIIAYSDQGGVTAYAMTQSWIEMFPTVGYHTWVWLERDQSGGGTTTWAGDDGTAYTQTGLTGMVKR